MPQIFKDQKRLSIRLATVMFRGTPCKKTEWKLISHFSQAFKRGIF